MQKVGASRLHTCLCV